MSCACLGYTRRFISTRVNFCPQHWLLYHPDLYSLVRVRVAACYNRRSININRGSKRTQVQPANSRCWAVRLRSSLKSLHSRFIGESQHRLHPTQPPSDARACQTRPGRRHCSIMLRSLPLTLASTCCDAGGRSQQAGRSRCRSGSRRRTWPRHSHGQAAACSRACSPSTAPRPWRRRRRASRRP